MPGKVHGILLGVEGLIIGTYSEHKLPSCNLLTTILRPLKIKEAGVCFWKPTVRVTVACARAASSKATAIVRGSALVGLYLETDSAPGEFFVVGWYSRLSITELDEHASLFLGHLCQNLPEPLDVLVVGREITCVEGVAS